jgi:hypothetical protein
VSSSAEAAEAMPTAAPIEEATRMPIRMPIVTGSMVGETLGLGIRNTAAESSIAGFLIGTPKKPGSKLAQPVRHSHPRHAHGVVGRLRDDLHGRRRVGALQRPALVGRGVVVVTLVQRPVLVGRGVVVVTLVQRPVLVGRGVVVMRAGGRGGRSAVVRMCVMCSCVVGGRTVHVRGQVESVGGSRTAKAMVCWHKVYIDKTALFKSEARVGLLTHTPWPTATAAQNISSLGWLTLGPLPPRAWSFLRPR